MPSCRNNNYVIARNKMRNIVVSTLRLRPKDSSWVNVVDCLRVGSDDVNEGNKDEGVTIIEPVNDSDDESDGGDTDDDTDSLTDNETDDETDGTNEIVEEADEGKYNEPD